MRVNNIIISQREAPREIKPISHVSDIHVILRDVDTACKGASPSGAGWVCCLIYKV